MIIALLVIDVLLAVTLLLAVVYLRTRQRRAEQRADEAKREWFSRQHPPAASLGSQAADDVGAVHGPQDGILATSVMPEPPVPDVPPLVVGEGADPSDRSIVPVGPGRRSPTVGGFLVVWQPGPTDAAGGAIGQMTALRAEQDALPPGSPAWPVGDLDQGDLAASLAGGVGKTITPDGFDWLIRRSHTGEAPAAALLTALTPTGLSPDASHTSSGPSATHPASRS